MSFFLSSLGDCQPHRIFFLELRKHGWIERGRRPGVVRTAVTTQKYRERGGGHAFRGPFSGALKGVLGTRISEHRSPLFVSALLRYSSLSITSGSWLCEGRRYKRGRSKKTGLTHQHFFLGRRSFFLILFYCCFSVTPLIKC